jgi:1,4-dihydroxy-2-naphthoate octaprenyltransferase
MVVLSAQVRGLIAGCHPGPTLVVTAAITGLAVALGRGPIGSLGVLVAVLSGQWSVGWANDAYDAERDRRAQRWNKPVVRGWVSERTLWVAAGTAATACIPLSLLAGGVIGGAAHILAVASAWAYDLWLKTTIWSFVPYMLSFGLVAPFLTYGLTPPQPPAGWAVLTLSLVGLGAHLANGIPDIDTDRATDSHGLVGRLGGRLSANLAVLALLAATALLGGHLNLPPTTAVVILAGLAAVSVLAATAAGGWHLFKLVMLLALIDALLLSLNPSIIIGA